MWNYFIVFHNSHFNLLLVVNYFLALVTIPQAKNNFFLLKLNDSWWLKRINLSSTSKLLIFFCCHAIFNVDNHHMWIFEVPSKYLWFLQTFLHFKGYFILMNFCFIFMIYGGWIYLSSVKYWKLFQNSYSSMNFLFDFDLIKVFKVSALSQSIE